MRATDFDLGELIGKALLAGLGAAARLAEALDQPGQLGEQVYLLQRELDRPEQLALALMRKGEQTLAEARAYVEGRPLPGLSETAIVRYVSLDSVDLPALRAKVAQLRSAIRAHATHTETG
ncbi:MAG: hypothetical protein KME03_13835 [Aphanocapsa lilacina HA4352-LM1]|jgi:hypothetical protein|nr:hypothetical protein [Aphanocapsa lilacina HA4352-LM1]